MSGSRASMIPVMISSHVPPKFVEDFLSAAYAGPAGKLETPFTLRVLDSPDVENAVEPSRPPYEESQGRQVRLATTPKEELFRVISRQPRLVQDIVIFLDNATGHESKGTCVLLKQSPSESKYVRTDFASVLAVVTAMKQGRMSIEQLKNQAAIDGGSLTQYGRHGVASIGTTLSYLSSTQGGLGHLTQRTQEWDPRRQVSSNICVFCTTDFSQKFLNRFITSAYKQEWIPYTGCTFTLVDTVIMSMLQPTTKTVVPTDRIMHSNPFRGKDVYTINNFVKRNFPGHEKFEHKYFLVFDQHTACGRGCIVADNTVRGGPDLALARLSLECALITWSALATGVQRVEELADWAAQANGMFHFPMSRAPQAAQSLAQYEYDEQAEQLEFEL